MKHLLLLTAFLMAARCMAEDIRPETWMKGMNEIYVASFSMTKFPNKEMSEKYLILAILKTTWDDTGNLKQAKIRNGIRKLLSGEWTLNAAKIAQIKAALADANIFFAVKNKPAAFLRSKGLRPRTFDEP